jgi:hypothetical protein
MHLFLPCSRFRVRYLLSIGTPYSKLDQLILRSVGEGVHTIEGLSDTFKLSSNVLVQSLVALIQAGWLALGDRSEYQFSLTNNGKKAIESKQIPRSVIYRQETAEILLELVTGCLIPRGEVTYRTFQDLDIGEPWNHPQVLRTEITDKSPDEGQVQNLLPRRLGERLHWIEDIRRVSKDFECLPLDVDLENGKITNLPLHRSLLLYEKVMSYAKDLVQESQGDQVVSRSIRSFRRRKKEESIFKLPKETYGLSWNPDDLLTDTHHMSTSLLSAFQQAYEHLLIVSRNMSTTFVNDIQEALLEAVNRGVKVYFLWGHHADPESLNLLKRLAYQTEQRGSAGQLLFNKEPCSFNSALIIFDKAKLVFEAIIGNQDWLSLPKDFNVLPEFGFRVHGPEILASLARIIGGYTSEMTSHSMRVLASTWKHIAAEISSPAIDSDNDSTSGKKTTQVRLVQSTNDHLETLLEFMEFPTQRFYILSSSIDSAGRRRLTRNLKFPYPNIKLAAVVGTPKNSSNPDQALDLDHLYEYLGINTNVIVTEKATCITSCPPLLGMQLVRAERNLGIVLYDKVFSKTILDKIDQSILVNMKGNKR